MRIRPSRTAVPAFVATLLASTMSMPMRAAPSWGASVGAEADDNSASVVDADLNWSLTDKFGLSFAAGQTSGPSDQGDFDSTTLFVGMDWQISRLVGVSLGYDTWDDSDTFEKRTAHGSLYIGNERARFGILAQSIESETTAELTLLRRTTTFGFDGSAFGAELVLNGEHASLYASYLSYDYDENVDRLLTFLANPNIVQRPRLEALISSGLTSGGALLDSSATIGGDFFVRDVRIGVSFSNLHDIVSDSDSNTLRADVEWPLSDHWSARLIGGVNDNDITNSTLFGGARIIFRSN